MKKNEKQKTIKKTNDLKKNKAEKFIVCLSWIFGLGLFFMGLVLISIIIFPQLTQHHNILLDQLRMTRKLTQLLIFFFLILSLVFYIIAKIRKFPHVRPKYYRNLLILILLLFFVVACVSYNLDYVCCD